MGDQLLIYSHLADLSFPPALGVILSLTLNGTFMRQSEQRTA